MFNFFLNEIENELFLDIKKVSSSFKNKLNIRISIIFFCWIKVLLFIYLYRLKYFLNFHLIISEKDFRFAVK